MKAEGFFRLVRCFLPLFIALWTDLPVEAKAPPNVIFILADDWGWGDLKCYGHPDIQTPNLDRLASQGSRFTDFYVNSPVCSPSRAGFLTGLFPARARIHHALNTPQVNRSRGTVDFLDPNLPTVTGVLKKAGYVTGHYGKWHLESLEYGGEGFSPERYGFSEWKVAETKDWYLWDRDIRSRSSAMIIDETIGFVERNKGKPFYVQAWLLDVHGALSPTDEQLKPYQKFSAVSYKNPFLSGRLEQPATEPLPYSTPARIYYSSVTDADKQIGRLLQRLEELGLADNTIVIFSSDNGPEDIEIYSARHSGVGSSGPFRGRKRSLYEGGIRVPFIVRWPGVTPAGKINDSVVSAVDLFPTLCSIANISLPKGLALDGEDMSAALRGKNRSRSRPLLWEWRFSISGHVINKSPMLAIRSGQWKLLMNPDRSRVELYDIVSDPSEVDNLSDRHPDLVKTLSKQLLRWKANLPPGPTDPTAGQNRYPWPQQE